MRSEDIIIIDFEGLMNHPPSFVGVWSNHIYKIIILDENMIGLTDQTNVIFSDLKTFLTDIAFSCRNNNKMIIGYSNRELNVFHDFGIDITDIYYNPISDLGRWFWQNRNIYTRPGPLALKSVLKVLQYPEFHNFGDRQTTQRIKHVTNQLVNNNQNFEKLTPVAKGKWTKLKNYNYQDVVGLLWVLVRTGLVVE